jgi:hypothetical protein
VQEISIDWALRQVRQAVAAGRYGPLPAPVRDIVRKHYAESVVRLNISLNGGRSELATKAGTPFANGWRRVVVGDFGPYIEIPSSRFYANPTVMDPRVYEEVVRVRFSREPNRPVKYIWCTVADDSDIKLYLQRRPVNYADYIVDCYYVAPEEVTIC